MKRGQYIHTERLTIRNWMPEHDGDAFFRLNNDPDVMRFFPGRRTRAETEKLFGKIDKQLNENGYSWSAVCLRDTGQVIGFGGIAKVEQDFPHGPSTEIGWRFIPESWGQGFATEMGVAMLRYAFEALKVPEVISFAVLENDASFAVMERLGMSRDIKEDFDHPGIDAKAYPNLVRHGCCRLKLGQWRKQKRPENPAV